MAVLAVIGALAGLVSAACGLLCLRELRRRGAPGVEQGGREEDGGEDAALREGILNLMRYAPAETGKEEE